MDDFRVLSGVFDVMCLRIHAVVLQVVPLCYGTSLRFIHFTHAYTPLDTRIDMLNHLYDHLDVGYTCKRYSVPVQLLRYEHHLAQPLRLR